MDLTGMGGLSLVAALDKLADYSAWDRALATGGDPVPKLFRQADATVAGIGPVLGPVIYVPAYYDAELIRPLFATLRNDDPFVTAVDPRTNERTTVPAGLWETEWLLQVEPHNRDAATLQALLYMA